MLEYLSHIDFTLVIAFVIAAGGWIYNEARLLKTEGIRALAEGIADQAVEHALMDATGILDSITPANATERVDAWVWAELAKHGIAKSDSIDMLVKPAIAAAVSRILGGIRDRLDADGPKLTVPSLTASGQISPPKTPQAGFVKIGLVVMIAAIGAALLFGCGADARHKALSGTFTSLDLAAAALVKVSGDEETAIQTKAPDEATGDKQLADWRTKVDEAEKTIDTGYRAVAAAALADDDQSLATVLQIAAILRDELAQLGVKL